MLSNAALCAGDVAHTEAALDVLADDVRKSKPKQNLNVHGMARDRMLSTDEIHPYASVIDVGSGLFALGGVALAAVFSEVRAWRENRGVRLSTLYDLRRATNATAQRQVEDLAAALARWANEGAPADDEPSRV